MAAGTAGEHVVIVNVAPEGLGTVTVRAHLGADGLRVELTPGNDAGREALRGVLAELRRDLALLGPGTLTLAAEPRATDARTSDPRAHDPRLADGRSLTSEPGEGGGARDRHDGWQHEGRPTASGDRTAGSGDGPGSAASEVEGVGRNSGVPRSIGSGQAGNDLRPSLGDVPDDDSLHPRQHVDVMA